MQMGGRIFHALTHDRQQIGCPLETKFDPESGHSDTGCELCFNGNSGLWREHCGSSHSVDSCPCIRETYMAMSDNSRILAYGIAAY